MQKSNRLSLRRQIRHFKNAFFQIGDDAFTQVLPETLVRRISASGDPREEIFSPLITLRAFLFQVLSASGSCKEAVSHVLTERIACGLRPNSMNTGPYCKARNRLSLPPLKEAVIATGTQLQQRIPDAWKWKGFNIKLVDGSTLLMPDTEDNQQAYPQQNTQKPGLGFPIMRIVALFSLATGACLSYAVGPYQGKGTGETSLLGKILNRLNPKDLLIADRCYSTYAIIAILLNRGVPVLFRLNANKKADFRKGRSIGTKDHLIEHAKPKRKPVWISQEVFDELPALITVREFTVNGVVYVTTLLEAKDYPKKELAVLYRQRWNIELDFRNIKTNMGMEMLRCQSPEMVRKEIAVHFLAYNLIRSNLVRAAINNDKQARELSFMAALQLIRTSASLGIQMTSKALVKLMSPLLDAMAYSVIGKRKRQNQPRVVKRRPKAYSLMTKPRYQYTTNCF